MSKVEFEDSKNPDYRYVYATGAFGAITPNDARIIFYLDRLVPKTIAEGEKAGTAYTGKISRELQVELHMSPQEFVNLWRWMTERLQIYKKTFPDFPLNIPEFEPIAEQAKQAKPEGTEMEPKGTE